jgi:hypothetical protein
MLDQRGVEPVHGGDRELERDLAALWELVEVGSDPLAEQRFGVGRTTEQLTPVLLAAAQKLAPDGRPSQGDS